MGTGQGGGVSSRLSTSVFRSSVCYRAPELLELSRSVQIILNASCFKTDRHKHVKFLRW